MDYQEAKEEFKVSKLKQKQLEKAHGHKSPELGKEDAQTIPEYYFDLTRGVDDQPLLKEHTKIVVKSERPSGRTNGIQTHR
jgi:hypothetical protein